ncbi:hypothetical protein BX600DRAFT_12679 [Xylariales sp. PMI_506]|nr:hypothetical protein BX600DRAFT_12679 [Xylariales sp. PMI_506]
MGVEESVTMSCWWPTESLILKSRRKHYRTNISPWHWQLRSLVSAEGNDTLYFPTGINNNHITRLNTQTRAAETIKILNFNPRSLVAKNGWICCGGENGEFAVIRDVEQTDGSENAAHRTNVDDALSSNFQSHLRSLESPTETSLASSFSRDMFHMLEQRLNGPTKTWTTSSHKYGSDRVNCVTIWEPPQASSLFPARPGHYETPVAILANNDKTVTIVSLHDCSYLDELTLPDSVNRSVISPDGSLMASICDDPFLYLHLRKPVSQGRSTEVHEWKSLPRVRLEYPKPGESSECRGSFTACYSASGRYLAVGTQHGTILVYDVSALQNQASDPLITSFNSDQYPESSGAVRDMAFCPGPYDLLAWTEHRGRIGIADARTNFMQRQVIALDQTDDYEKLSLNDRNTIDPRLLEHRAERSTGAGSPSHLARLLSQVSSPQSSSNAEASSDAAERLNHPFTPEETAILEAVQNDRRRREAREAREQIAQEIARGSTPWRTSIWADRVSSSPLSSLVSLRAALDHMERAIAIIQPSRDGVIAHMPHPQRESLTRLLERRDSREPRQTTGQTEASDGDRERRAPTPRRRSSVMPTTLNQNSDNATSGARSQAAANNVTATSRDSPTPWAPGSSRVASGWADLEALYNISGGDTGLNEAARNESTRSRRTIPAINDVWNDDLSGFGLRRNYARLNGREHQQYPDDTAGLTWSEDGSILWVATEDGVYEFRVNVQGRKIFPDITLR